MSVTPWTFDVIPVAPRRPHVMLLVFGVGPLETSEVLSGAKFGAARESLGLCDVRTIPRAADSAWFDEWRRGSVRAIAEQDLGAELAVLDAADHVHVISCAPDAVTDLSYLQAAWAFARYACANGGQLVLDAHAMTFTMAGKLQAAGEPLVVKREVRIVYETDSTRADLAHALHTRGLRKFGAPDLVALCTDADVPLVAHAITELAESVARGRDLATPAHAIEVAPGVRWIAVEDEHHLGDLLQLNNAARVIVDDAGHDLVGVMARLPPPTSS